MMFMLWLLMGAVLQHLLLTAADSQQLVIIVMSNARDYRIFLFLFYFSLAYLASKNILRRKKISIIIYEFLKS